MVTMVHRFDGLVRSLVSSWRSLSERFRIVWCGVGVRSFVVIVTVTVKVCVYFRPSTRKSTD